MSQSVPYKLLLPELCKLAGFPLGDVNGFLHGELWPELAGVPGRRYDCAFNWLSRKYVFVNDSIRELLGYDCCLFLERGLEFLLSVVHPEDLVFLKEIHRRIFACFYDTPAEQRGDLKFCYNLRLRAADGSFVHVLRESVFCSAAAQGGPLIEYIQCTDISAFRESAFVRLVVYRRTGLGAYVRCHDEVFKGKGGVLSLREREVAALAARGLTSKEIASVLNLSMDTVKSHRKNIMMKMGAGNLMEAVVKGGMRDEL